MRDFKNMKRQRGRNRGGGQGGGRPQQNANRAFESNGPDNVKIRGHAQHVFEKYQQLARDAFSSGDRVLAENYLQHADHYFRLLRTIQPNRSPSEILGRDTMASGLDIDFEEEVEVLTDDAAVAEAGETGEGHSGSEQRQDGARQEGGRQDRYDRDNRQDRFEGREGNWRDRQDRDRQDNRAGFERQDRGERPYGDRPDRNRNYNDRPQEGERYEGQRNDRYEGRRDNRRFDGRRDDGRREDFRRDDRNFQREPRESRYEPRPEAFVEGPQPEVAEAPTLSAPVATEQQGEAVRILRSQDGAMSEAPAFLQPTPAEGEEARPRARRRRAPRSFEAGEGSSDGAESAPAAGAPSNEEG